MLLGSDSFRKLGKVFPKLDRLHMEVPFQEIYPVTLADFQSESSPQIFLNIYLFKNEKDSLSYNKLTK